MSYQSVIATIGAIAAIGFFISLIIALMMPTQRSSPCSLYESSLGNTSGTEEGYIRNRRTGDYLQVIRPDQIEYVGVGSTYDIYIDCPNDRLYEAPPRYQITRGGLGPTPTLFTRDSSGIARTEGSVNAKIDSGRLYLHSHNRWLSFTPFRQAPRELFSVQICTTRPETWTRWVDIDVQSAIPYDQFEWVPHPNQVAWGVCQANTVCPQGYACRDSGNGQPRCLTEGDCRWAQGADTTTSPNNCSAIDASTIVVPVANQTAWGPCTAGTVCPQGYACRDSGNGEPRCLTEKDCRWAQGADNTTSPNGCSAMSM